MRLSTDEDRDLDVAFETIAAAAGAGMTVDTAHSSLPRAGRRHNEALLARALSARAVRSERARIVTRAA